MQSKIDLFDQEFESILSAQHWRPEESKTRAFECLRNLIRGLEAVAPDGDPQP